MDKDDIEKVAKCIEERYGTLLNNRTQQLYGWSHPVHNLLDCVLSLNRPYKTFVTKRVKDFKKRHPEIVTFQQLSNLISSYDSPVLFSNRELAYDDSERAIVLQGVLGCLIDIHKKMGQATETQSIGKWANSVTPREYKSFGVFGFGIAGFQYLRMLFGVDTVKPDIYIKQFVGECVGRRVSEMTALCLLESAAQRLGYSPRQVDGVIWGHYASKKPQKRCNRTSGK